MAWNFDQSNPIYLQIISHLEYKILSGEYNPGDKLESVRELASIAGVNPNTMQKALQEMEGMGLIHTQRTSGRYITDDADALRQLRGNIAEEKAALFVKELRQLGYSFDEIVCIIQNQENPKSKAVTTLDVLMKEEKKKNEQ